MWIRFCGRTFTLSFAQKVRIFRLSLLLLLGIFLPILILYFDRDSQQIRKQLDWQVVVGDKDNSRVQLYVYSAYHVPHPHPPRIKIIGVTERTAQVWVHCRFYDNELKEIGATVRGHIVAIREHWNMTYSACFITCYLLPSRSKETYPRPAYVSLSTTGLKHHEITNLLPVQYSEDKINNSVEFSICVKPIYNYNQTLRFQEWMEFYLMMGVTHFTFYEISIGPSMRCLMEKVYGSKLITILPWTSPPLIPNVGIRGSSTLAALNDCVYRHRGFSKYLIIVDLDEILIPRAIPAQNYSELISTLYDVVTLEQRNKIGAFSFLSTFFFIQWELSQNELNMDILTYDLSSYSAVAQNLLTFSRTRRTHFFGPGHRSKYICEPEKVAEAGFHFIWGMEASFQECFVPSSLAALHHYRDCDSQCPEFTDHPDKYAHKFIKVLAPRVTESLAKFSEQCVSTT